MWKQHVTRGRNLCPTRTLLAHDPVARGHVDLLDLAGELVEQLLLQPDEDGHVPRSGSGRWHRPMPTPTRHPALPLKGCARDRSGLLMGAGYYSLVSSSGGITLPAGGGVVAVQSLDEIAHIERSPHMAAAGDTHGARGYGVA